MCPSSSLLMKSIIVASEVDLPEPVGPVTSTRPRGRVQMSLMWGGRPICSKVRIFCGIWRSTIAMRPFCLKALTRKRALSR